MTEWQRIMTTVLSCAKVSNYIKCHWGWEGEEEGTQYLNNKRLAFNNCCVECVNNFNTLLQKYDYRIFYSHWTIHVCNS